MWLVGGLYFKSFLINGGNVFVGIFMIGIVFIWFEFKLFEDEFFFGCLAVGLDLTRVLKLKDVFLCFLLGVWFLWIVEKNKFERKRN